jgi:hypothetical protein
MTATTMTANSSGLPIKNLILLAIIIALAAISVHALAKHGRGAIVANQCADYPELRMVNPQTGRIAFICFTEDGWGVAIIESNGNPVTSFLKDKAKRIEQVIHYMRNAGYELIK